MLTLKVPTIPVPYQGRWTHGPSGIHEAQRQWWYSCSGVFHGHLRHPQWPPPHPVVLPPLVLTSCPRRFGVECQVRGERAPHWRDQGRVPCQTQSATHVDSELRLREQQGNGKSSQPNEIEKEQPESNAGSTEGIESRFMELTWESATQSILHNRPRSAQRSLAWKRR